MTHTSAGRALDAPPSCAPDLRLQCRSLCVLPRRDAAMLTADALSSGQVVSHLNEMGFECVINAKRDFYADIAKGKVSTAPAGSLVRWKRPLVAQCCRLRGPWRAIS